MRVSIIIPAYDAGATLAQCIEACLAQTHPDVEVVVVDDGSTDDTPRIAQGFPVHYVRQANRGPAAARNRGAAEAEGCLVGFTDADCIPEPEWIERLVAGLADGVAAVGGTYAIANPDRVLARMVHEEIAARHARFREEVDFLGSFNVAYRKEAFEAAGGFDETFTRASGEDNDLAYRLLGQGHRLRFVSAARVAHFHPTRLGPYLRAQMDHGFWRVKLYAKHPARARRGDQYAGFTDLAAPPLALAMMAAFVLVGIALLTARGLAPAVLATLGLLWIYVSIHVPWPWAMARRTGDPRMMLFAGVAALRDVARAIGMLRGVVWFILLGKGRA